MGFWVQIGTSPIVYRYIDWSITVPLQMVEFYLILSAVQPNISGGMFWRLLLGTVFMLLPATVVKLASLKHGQDSSLAWPDGASSCSRSSRVKQDSWLPPAIALASMCRSLSASCVSSSQPVGAFTHLATSSDICWALSMMAPSIWCTTLPTSSTRSDSALPSGLLPRRTLRASSAGEYDFKELSVCA